MGVYLHGVSRLPSEYQEVERIRSSGSQYFNTGFYPTGNSEIEIDFVRESGSNVGTFGVDSGWTNNAFSILTDRIFCYGSQYQPSEQDYYTIGTRYLMKFKNLTCTLNGVTKFTYSSNSFTSSYSAYMFAKRRNNYIEAYSNTTCYSLKLWDNGTLARDYVPCYRKSDGVIGMYDLVNNTFNINQGSGVFTKGPDISGGELKSAYIGELYPESIELDKRSISLTTIGQTEQLTATIEPTISDHSITWSSDDTTIATVSTTGLVTCVTPGECTITATTVNGLTASCSVGQGRLPSAYQEVEYIEATGPQWIDSTYVPVSNSKAELKYCPVSRVSGGWIEFWICGVYYDPGLQWRAGIEGGGYLGTYQGFSYTPSDYYPTYGADYVAVSNGPRINGSLSNRSLYLFAQNNSGTPTCLNRGVQKLYYLKLWTGDTLERDFVPCYRKADGVIGLYDLVHNVFYTNSGSGTFNKGSDV